MAVYQAHFSSAGINAANGVLANLKTAASDRARILEVGVFIETAPTTAPVLALTRMNAVGTGAIASAASAPADGAEAAATTVLEITWATTKPTLIATPTYYRRAQLPLTVGAGIIWDFTNRPLLLPVSQGMLLVDVLATGATLGLFGGYFVWDE